MSLALYSASLPPVRYTAAPPSDSARPACGRSTRTLSPPGLSSRNRSASNAPADRRRVPPRPPSRVTLCLSRMCSSRSARQYSSLILSYVGDAWLAAGRTGEVAQSAVRRSGQGPPPLGSADLTRHRCRAKAFPLGLHGRCSRHRSGVVEKDPPRKALRSAGRSPEGREAKRALQRSGG
jgi:hypothetical protein